mmetsp:Transcript_19845/g.57019  ORF Transcript_19845/g.57019 Transcript_19845/m.57019 type:complete len:183 (+) Transcript_19845:3-551(+)
MGLGGGAGLGGLLPGLGGYPAPPSRLDANQRSALDAAMRRLGAAGVRAGGGGGSQLARLSFMERDFTERDYEMLLQLDDEVGPEKKKALRANAKRLDGLPSRRLSKQDAKGNVCAICLEPLKTSQVVIDLPCRHDFHKGCILKWLKSSEAPSCPVCKHPALDSAEPGAAAPTPPPTEEWHHT